MKKRAVAVVTLSASLLISVAVVSCSPDTWQGETKILDTVFVSQILGAVAGLVFVMVPIIFSRMKDVMPKSKNGEAVKLLSELKDELRTDTYFLMLLFAASLAVGVLAEVDCPFVTDCFILSKSALVSIAMLWFLFLAARVSFGLLSSMLQFLTFDGTNTAE